MKLFETYSSTLSNITYFRTVLFSYAQLKGMKISEGIFNLAASSKKWTESLTLNISTYKKKFLGLVIHFSFFFFGFGQTENTFWNFPTFAYCENHNRRHSCLLHKIPRENLYSSWRCYKNHKQQSDMCMIKRKPWQTRVFHQILHFFLSFSLAIICI